MDKVQAIRKEAINSYKMSLAEDLKAMILCPDEIKDVDDTVKLMAYARNHTIVSILEMMGVLEE